MNRRMELIEVMKRQQEKEDTKKDKKEKIK
jgi:hypothetical protein